MFPAVKAGYRAFDVSGIADILLFAGVRFVICGAAISLFSFFRNKSDLRFSKRELFLTLIMGLFAIILHYACTYIGLSLTDSAKTALLKQSGALLYVIFAGLFFKDDKLTPSKFFGVIIGFLGIVVLNIGNVGFSFGIGEILIIAASLCTVASNIVGKHLYLTKAPIAAIGLSQLFGGAVMLAVGLICGGEIKIASNAAYPILFYIIIASSISYCIWALLVKSGNLSGLFIIKFIEPVFACVFGWLILGEDILKWQYPVAFILVVIGISISKIKKKSDG